MKSLILFLALWGGLSNAMLFLWVGISRLFRCMRYEYEVAYFDRSMYTMHTATVTAKRKLNFREDALSLRVYIASTPEELVSFKIISLNLVEFRSVLLQKIARGIYRACTRTADDAIREWKEAHAM